MAGGEAIPGDPLPTDREGRPLGDARRCPKCRADDHVVLQCRNRLAQMRPASGRAGLSGVQSAGAVGHLSAPRIESFDAKWKQHA
jgi:hypothetical protein